MSAITPAFARATLADRLTGRIGRSTLARDAALVVSGAALMSGLAQVSIPMFPVPITGQTLGVLLVGLTLGMRRGGLALVVYGLVALAGAPVLAGHQGGLSSLASPSFGFVIGFVPAAALAGLLAERRWDRSVVTALAAGAIVTIVPFLIGVPWLAVSLDRLGPAVWHGEMGAHSVLQAAIAGGVTPFLLGGLVKAVIAALVLPSVWGVVRRIDER
ncbi:hypothetical protein AX769_00760 [Frondihabitans sp. PAMC 28766]|uniref:biotin transporter BioY n=1 Tax=Frondihabitans sp. PAMC 28766 TaxID=1795630 RepID=UPI00078D1684|nr:biotin transporter BioY [Frondihabitans sp. PAMC 28766]AMM18936.1 hypothetical protein AX769_00760 [Frondihabitans sp. PAMC 28766]